MTAADLILGIAAAVSAATLTAIIILLAPVLRAAGARRRAR